MRACLALLSDPGSRSGFEETRDRFGEGGADSGNFGELVGACLADPGQGSENPEEGCLPAGADSWAFIEQALLDPTLHEKLVVGVGPAVSFVSDSLEKLQGSSLVIDDDRI